MNLRGKVAIVTGASRGIGRAIAKKLAQEGSDVVCNYHRSSDQIQTLLQECEGFGVKVLAIQADISKPTEAERLIQYTYDTFGKIDILVNNAGIVKDKLLMMYKNDDWDEVMQTNLNGTYYCTKAVLRPMLMNRSGKIIHLASTTGLNGNVGQSCYSASKGAIIAFSKSVAREVGRYNINVNAVAPGYIETDMMNGVPKPFIQKYMELNKLARLGTPEEVAEVCAFLASDDSSYIHGQTIVVDGGVGI